MEVMSLSKVHRLAARAARRGPGRRQRFPLAVVTILAVLVACGDESAQNSPDSTSVQSSGTSVTAADGEDCPDDQRAAAIAYEKGLRTLVDRADAATLDVQRVLGGFFAREFTADRTDFPKSLRASADLFTAIDHDLADLGPPPTSHVDPVATFSNALDSYARGLDTMAQGAEDDSAVKVSEGLGLVTTAANVIHELDAATGALSC